MSTLYRHPMGTVAYPCHDAPAPELSLGLARMANYGAEIRHGRLVVFLYRRPMTLDRSGWEAAGWWPAEHGPRPCELSC